MENGYYMKEIIIGKILRRIRVKLYFIIKKIFSFSESLIKVIKNNDNKYIYNNTLALII